VIKKTTVFKFFVFISLGIFVSPTFADNTGGVFGPVVNEGHKSFEYRIGIDPNNAAGETSFAHRIHYQQAINGDFQWRVLAQARKTAESDNDFDFIQGELTWEFAGTDNYKTGMRFDLRLRDEGRANQVGVNWMNQFKLSNDWYSRFLVLTTIQIGSNSASGVGLQTRANLWKKSSYGDVGVELFSSYGTTEKFKDFSDQSHAIGPFFQKAIGKDGWQIYAGVLLGITDASPDTDFRFRLSKKL
jgi:hypothetical protein